MDDNRLLEALKIIEKQTENWQAGLAGNPTGLLGSIRAVAQTAIAEWTLAVQPQKKTGK